MQILHDFFVLVVSYDKNKNFLVFIVFLFKLFATIANVYLNFSKIAHLEITHPLDDLNSKKNHYANTEIV